MWQRENLEPAGIREHRFLPTHEAVNASHITENFWAWPQEKMVGIRQKNLRTRFLQKTRCLRLHGGMRSHRHKKRGSHLIV